MERRGRSLFFFLTIIYALMSCCTALENSNNNHHNSNSNGHRKLHMSNFINNEVVVEVDEIVYSNSKRGDNDKVVYNSLASNCGQHQAVDGSKFDLSSLTTTDGYNASLNGVTYLWNFCAPMTGSLVPIMCPQTPSAYAYIVNGTGANQKCFDIGDTTVQWTLSDGVNGPGSGVQINYGTTSGCLTIVRVNCNANIDYVWWRNAQPFPNNCTFIITVQARNGCKLKTGSGETGLSGGSIFLIVFFVGMATYFLLGSLIKWKLMGAPVGVDMIPNVEFWTQLPGLTFDGCKFTKAKIMGLFGGGYNSI